MSSRAATNGRCGVHSGSDFWRAAFKAKRRLGEGEPVAKAPRLPWKPAPVIAGSVALHLLAGGLIAARPLLWSWAAGAVVLDHLFLTACGLWPRSSLLGPNVTRL